MEVSAVICTHTEARWSYLVDAVKSIQNQTVPPLEIILVIDHNPALREKACRQLPGITAIENTGLQGASGSKNSGIAAARGEVIAFLDDDACAETDWLEQLMVEFEKPDIAGVGGMTKPKWTGEPPRWFPEEFYWVIGCTHRGMPEGTAPVRNLIACNMAVQKQIFKEIGGFRDGMGPMGGKALGCEETEFCIRTNQKLEQVIWLHKPAAVVYHHVPAARTTWRYFYRRCYGEGLSKALVTHFAGGRDGLSSELAYTIRVLPRGIAQSFSKALINGELVYLARALAILSGLAASSAGFFFGLVQLRLKAAK